VAEIEDDLDAHLRARMGRYLALHAMGGALAEFDHSGRVVVLRWLIADLLWLAQLGPDDKVDKKLIRQLADDVPEDPEVCNCGKGLAPKTQ